MMPPSFIKGDGGSFHFLSVLRPSLPPSTIRRMQATSVLCARTPNFLTTLAQRHDDALKSRPHALIGEDEHVWAASPLAQEQGVRLGMAARNAQASCPDILLRRLDLDESRSAQTAYLDSLAAWEIPVEEATWGAGWIDLRHVADQRTDVQGLAAQLGKRIRTNLGADLVPSIGWNSSKFTSRAAAIAAAPGAMRLVDKSNQRRFLDPLPVGILPLPWQALELLGWLGVDTLGAYAKLPPTGVLQRWGKEGALVQNWAQGKDDRPVSPARANLPEPVIVEYDPPTDLLGNVVLSAMNALAPTLNVLRDALRGIRSMSITLSFVTGADRIVPVTFVEPAADAARIQATLFANLQTIVWHDEVNALTFRITQTGEPPPGQLALFSIDADRNTSAAVVFEIAQQLRARYGHVVYLGKVVEPNHPAHEHRALVQRI